MKIHVGCGTVYLDGYVNTDVKSPTCFLARDRPDLVERYRTTEDRYYARHEDKTIDSLRAGPVTQETVCDVYWNVTDPPLGVGGMGIWQELLMRHSFEHLSIREATSVLPRLTWRFAKGGMLRIDVPDHEETLKKLMETQDPFYIRHLLGPRHSDYGYHMMSYTRDRLIRLVVDCTGFRYVGEEPNIHFYPAFCLRFQRG